ncbi:MAG: hypothetical protein RR278_00225 [Mucinivorans sp.]
MKHSLPYLFVLALLLTCDMAEGRCAQKIDKQNDTTVVKTPNRTSIKGKMYSDTLLTMGNYHQQKQDADQLYDTISRSRSWVARTLASLLIASSSDVADEANPTPKLELSRHYFQDFGGAVITQINVVQANVFTRVPGEDPGWAGRFLDKIHIQTHENVIRRNLLFDVGDTISPYRMAINEQLLRSLPYLSTAYIVVSRREFHPNEVVVSIFARDSWTISVDGSWGHNYYGDLFDRNFLGTGDELRIRYYLPMGNQKRGFEGQYQFNNLFGTFTNVKLVAGVGASNNTTRIEASRPFILPSDHIWGFRAGYTQSNHDMQMLDTTINVKVADYALWYGYAWNLDPRLGTVFYGMFSTAYQHYYKRPEVGPKFNPFYHTTFNVSASIGFSRQNYYQGNMIYGYGRTEDIPFGYKFEAVGGYQWSESLGRRYYAGLNLLWGNALGNSYLNLAGRVGGYWNKERKWEQVMLDFSARYFSPLFKLGRIYVRQFFSLGATWGINRFDGEREQINFDSYRGVRGMYVEQREDLGHNRAAFNAETVFFSPIFLYHFRFAFYLWGDFGFMGRNPDIFANKFSSAMGIGIRIKNERLIFNNIQLRFGVMLRKPENYGFNWFDLSNESTLEMDSFRPQVPRPIDYH